MVPVAVIVALAGGAMALLRHAGGENASPGSPTDPAGAVNGAHEEIRVGSTLPEFALKRLDGTELKSSSLESKVTLVNFWATWCEACMVEMPAIVQLRSQYKDKGFDEAPGPAVDRALRQFKIEFPVLRDDQQKLVELLDIHAIPVSLVLDRNRKVLFMIDGDYDWNSTEFRQKLEGWLAS
jgi:thiol-disulfide isomerase/thioredoxin